MKSPSNLVFLDIETRPVFERVESWLEPQDPYVSPPKFDPDNLINQELSKPPEKSDWSKIARALGVRCGNIKDEAKVMEKVVHSAAAAAERDLHGLEEHVRRGAEVRHTAFEKAALSPRTAEIFMIQWASLSGPVFILCQDGNGNTEHRRYYDDDGHLGEILEVGRGGERHILETFFKLRFDEQDNRGMSYGGVTNPVADSVLVNWTGCNDKANFDWNMIQRRALALGIEVPWLQLPRALRPKFLDLTPQFLEHDRWNSFCSLEKAAKELGIETPKTPVTGEHCWRFFLGEMKWDYTRANGGMVIPVEWREQKSMALDYARNDILLLRDIYDRMYSV